MESDQDPNPPQDAAGAAGDLSSFQEHVAAAKRLTNVSLLKPFQLHHFFRALAIYSSVTLVFSSHAFQADRAYDDSCVDI